jgi:hypothetical protein
MVCWSVGLSFIILGSFSQPPSNWRHRIYLSNRKKLVERRRHRRFQAPKDAFVALGPHYVKLGHMIDVSMDGLAFCYKAREEPSNRSFELDIFLPRRVFYLQGMPFKTISDFQSDGIPFSSVRMRRMCVQFGDLTAYQSGRLKYFIKKHTTEGVV